MAGSGHRARRRAWHDPGLPRRGRSGSRRRSCCRARQGSARRSYGKPASRRRDEAIRPRPDVPRHRSGSIALVRRALGAARAGLRRRRGLAVAAATPSARGRAPARRARRRGAGCRTRSASRCSTCCVRWPSTGRFSSRWTTCSGSIRHLQASSRSHFDVCATEQVGLLATVRRRTRPREPRSSSIARSPRRGSCGSRSARSAWAPSTPCSSERLGLELTRPELVRVQEATAGNPFFALELGRELVRTDTRPAPGQALRVPESLRELLGGRLARLPAETVDVLVQVAALARPTVELVAAAYGDDERVVEALEAAVREGVVELDDSRIRFAHPLLASICYEQAPVWKRRAVHRALAGGSLGRRGARPPSGARREGPDAVVASNLEAAAEQAPPAGRTAAAAELSRARGRADAGRSRARAAAALTRGELSASRRRRRAGGRDARAAARRGSVRESSGPTSSSSLPRHSARDAPTTDRALRRGAGRGGRRRRPRRRGSSASGASIRLLQTDVRAALGRRPRGAREGRARGRPRADRRGDRAGGARRDVGRPRSLRVCSNAASRSRSASGSSSSSASSPRFALGRASDAAWRARATSRDCLEEVEASGRRARRRGDAASSACWYLSMLEWFAGRWQRALEHATTAQRGRRARRRTRTRDVGGTRQGARRGGPRPRRPGARVGRRGTRASRGLRSNETSSSSLTLGVLGRLELELGNVEAAGDYLRDLPRAVARQRA